MASRLFEELVNLPDGNVYFDQIEDIKLEPFGDDDDDDFGSCCSSPLQSSSGSASPTQSSDNSSSSPVINHGEKEYFTFASCANIETPTKKKKQTKFETKFKRNERERRRVRRLAEGFRKLRSVVPGETKKLSKLQTLQTALQYMSQLSSLIAQDLQENERSTTESIQPQAYLQTLQQFQPLQQQTVTKTLSHPPLNWPSFTSVQSNVAQQMHTPINESCSLYTLLYQQQVPMSAWYCS